MSVEPGGPTPLFRWDGAYWGFVQDGQVYDRYGRHVGWLEARSGSGADVYHRSGRFLGELHDRHYVLRSVLRAEPIHRSERPPVPRRTSPAPVPDRGPRPPVEGRSDALPWPLVPPLPPRP